jgi:hypothetical protein
MEEKVYSVCLEFKALDNFHKHKKAKYDYHCNSCKKETKYEKLECGCGRYYTREHYKRHLKNPCTFTVNCRRM